LFFLYIYILLHVTTATNKDRDVKL